LFVKFILFTLNSVIVRFGEKYFNTTDGIITGDNHSVFLVNIAMHYSTIPAISILKQAKLYRRFIDDIIWVSLGQKQTQVIECALVNVFSLVGLNVTIRKFNTSNPDQRVEFLDVLHVHYQESEFKFVTKNFVKSTAMH